MNKNEFNSNSCKNVHLHTIHFQVHVSGDVSSRHVADTNRQSNTEDDGIYNHLHEDHIELQDQSDYDHCPPQAAPDDMYSHLDSGHDNSEDYMGDYGMVN